MKHFWIIGFQIIISLILVKNVSAQDLDLSKLTADPNTLMFSDEKTRVVDYINTMLQQKTTCCETEDLVHVRLKFKSNGCVDTAVVLKGKNKCINQSIEELLSQIKWSLETPNKPTPVVFSMKIDIPCKAGRDNKFQPVKAPAKPSECQKAAPVVVAEEKPKTPPTPAKPVQPVIQPIQKPQPKETKPKETPSETFNPKIIEGDTSALKKLRPTVLPDPKYVSRGDLKTNTDHIKTYINEQGPQYTVPQFLDGRTGMAIFIKSAYRKLGVCGLANVLTEITINSDGTVKEFRIFTVNPNNTEEENKVREAVRKATPYVLSSMKFRPVPREQYFMLQYKTHVDCLPNVPKMKESEFKQVNFFFNIPDKGARSRQNNIVPKTDTMEEEPRSN